MRNSRTSLCDQRGGESVETPFAAAGADNLSRAWARVTVTGGTGVVALASLLDNRTNDPTTFPMIRTTSAADDVWLQVATHTPGLRGGLWQTDLGILNAGDEPVSVEVRFHASSVPIHDDVTVGAGQQTVLSDVVGQLAATGSAALELVAQGPVAVSSRTYTEVVDVEGCVQGGILGQGFSAYALVTVLSGDGVLASASVIDNLSNDASTQPALR